MKSNGNNDDYNKLYYIKCPSSRNDFRQNELYAKAMKDATAACKNKKKTYNEIAEIYSVPLTSLKSALKAQKDVQNVEEKDRIKLPLIGPPSWPGRPRFFSKEEVSMMQQENNERTLSLNSVKIEQFPKYLKESFLEFKADEAGGIDNVKFGDTVPKFSDRTVSRYRNEIAPLIKKIKDTDTERRAQANADPYNHISYASAARAALHIPKLSVSMDQFSLNQRLIYHDYHLLKINLFHTRIS